MGTQEVEKQQQFHGVPHQVFMKDNYFRRWYPTWIHNAMENYPQIKKDFKNKNCCISAHPRPMNKPAIILGAGPSFDKAAPLLKDWRHPIFSPTSSLFALLKWERKPEYICAFDSLWSIYEHFKFKKYSWENTTLVTHPNAEPKLLKAWKWNKFYYRRVFPRHEFFELTFPLMFPWIKMGIRFSGCVINNAVSIASFLGFNPIFLVGTDLGWKDDKNIRATRWEETKEGWIRLPKVVANNEKKIPENKNGITTYPEFASFKEGLLSIVNTEPNIDFIDCSDGLVNELTKVDIERVIMEQGFGDYKVDKESQQKKVRCYFDELKESRKHKLDELKESRKNK